jgi:hypothetical protein
MGIFNVFNKIKDKGVASLLKVFINKQIKDYGSLSSVKINSKNKDLILDIRLRGEHKSIQVNVDKYEIIHKDDETFLKFNTISASREWINALIQNVAIPNIAPKKMIEIPSKYARIIELLI